ncbi:hypothetical protein MKEN_00358600 [Mycena kentingensis (nom. inval.)]|nr:hypothetical protein MKEN_00358600 [Mycena kentingensis (nom. inval.)]
MLCSNRFPLPGAPSTCTLDSIIVPLPSFLFLVALPIAQLGLRRTAATQPPRFQTKKWVHIAYLALVAAQICMCILELVRLVLEELGVGLLPVNIAGLICAFVVLWRERVPGRTKMMLQLLFVYWILLSVVEAIKTARLHKLEVLNPTTTKTSKYPSSDWFLDNAVMHGLYVVFACAEAGALLFAPRVATEPTKTVSDA